MARARLLGARPFAPLTAADSLVLRIGFAAAAGFAIAALLDWEFSFMTPLLAVQILAAMPRRPTLVQGLAIPLAILLATQAAMFASALLAGLPHVLLAVVGLAVFWSFYGQRLGAPGIIMLMVQIAFCCVPLMSTVSIDLARQFSEFLLKSSLAAMAIVWVAHGLLPGPPPQTPATPPPPPAPGMSRGRASWVALSDTLVLLPLLALFLSGGDVNNVVIMMITINLLGEIEIPRSAKVAVVLLLANLIGGVAAVLTHQFVLLSDSLLLFLMSVLFVALFLGARLAKGGPTAPIYALALATFFLVLGLAITPIPTAAAELFTIRLLKVALACGYALGALSLVGWVRQRYEA